MLTSKFNIYARKEIIRIWKGLSFLLGDSQTEAYGLVWLAGGVQWGWSDRLYVAGQTS